MQNARSYFQRTSRRRVAMVGLGLALMLAITASRASAETLLMPNRDAVKGTPVVVWGLSTLANGSTYTIDYGDTTSDSGTVLDQSYIAVPHAYSVSGPFTVMLTVDDGTTLETATVNINVYDPATLTASALRGLGINNTIQDGLRSLWYKQYNRTSFATDPTAYWYDGSGYARSWTALVVLAFENHGYVLPNNNGTPTGLYEKYLVRRGMNYIIDQLSATTLDPQPAGDPCEGVAASDPSHTGPLATIPPTCTGLLQNQEDEGYATSIAIMALAGSGAFGRNITEVPGSYSGGFTFGLSIGEIVQRMVDALAWGQNDGTPTCGYDDGRGGWYYYFQSCTSDGSTIGWNMVALLDASAGGVTIPAFVKPEFQTYAFANALNTDGSFDYNADLNPAGDFVIGPDVARAGVALQTMFYTGDTTLVPNSEAFISARWAGALLGNDYYYTCYGVPNKGCGYAMYNVFKGLKLLGIVNLPGVGDWYADYQDWLVANQYNPTDPAGGDWDSAMQFSCCASSGSADAALAELILSPVALVAPDPTLFATVGLAPATATNPVGSTHKVTATAQSANGTPVPGATVVFKVISGPNTGDPVCAETTTSQVTTDAGGHADCTYPDNGGGGTDRIQAYIGNSLSSNIVQKIWGDCNSAVASLSTLPYPLDHGLRVVTITGVPAAFSITGICQDENPAFPGDSAAYAQDGIITNATTARLRAELSGNRAAPSNGRVYRVKFTAPTLQCSGSVDVTVKTTNGTAVNSGLNWNSVTGANSCP